MSQASMYKASGVDIVAGERFVEMIKELVEEAWPERKNEIGGFSGELTLAKPTSRLALGSDGAGTVAILAVLANRLPLIGINGAIMSLFDVYAGGAHPVGLEDTLGVAKLVPERHIEVIGGVISACKASGSCILTGGETAELPDIFRYDWVVDLNTTVAGIPDDRIMTRDVHPGQPVFGWPSGGPASNGFSLIREVFGLKGDPDRTREILAAGWGGLSGTLADALLVPAPIWIREIEEQRSKGIHFAAHAHITGGGMPDNIQRILPDNCKVVINRGTWKRPHIFPAIQEAGGIDSAEMDQVFNQGIMAVSIVDGEEMASTDAMYIGHVVKRKGDEPQVELVGTFQD